MADKDSDHPLPSEASEAQDSPQPEPQEDELEEGEAEEEQEEHADTTSAPDTAKTPDDTTHTTTDEPPPLPDEPLPSTTTTDTPDDGWQPVWDPQNQAYYFHNRFTGATQWENPRIPDASSSNNNNTSNTTATASSIPATSTSDIHPAVRGGYNPAIHGDYDPTADYAVGATGADPVDAGEVLAPVGVAAAGGGEAEGYAATAQFNRFTGRFQAPELTPANHNDENKSYRQMNAFFDVDAVANRHDGRSLKAERASKRLSKSEVKRFKERRREKKEEKRRAWLRD